MDFLVWSIVVTAVVVGGVAAYYTWAQQRDAKLDAEIKEYNDETDRNFRDAIKRRHQEHADNVRNRTENQFRVDDANWRDFG